MLSRRTLRTNQIERTELWGYAFHHRDIDGMKTFLTQQPIVVSSVGPVLRSDLLDINPIDRQTIAESRLVLIDKLSIGADSGIAP